MASLDTAVQVDYLAVTPGELKPRIISSAHILNNGAIKTRVVLNINFAEIDPIVTDVRITTLKFYKMRPNTHTLYVDFDFVVLYHHEPFLEVCMYSTLISIVI